MIKPGGMDTGAIFSPCRTWRYVLWRDWGMGDGYAAFIGLNPSTADEREDDPTIRRCINFAKAWGHRGLYMLNLFAYRATDPKVMRAAADPIGPENDRFILEYTQKADVVVAAWGCHGRYRNRARDAGMWSVRPLMCLAVTKDGYPKHPLYLKGDLQPIPYPPSVPTEKRETVEAT